MYECGNGYLESLTEDQFRRLRNAARVEAHLRTATPEHDTTSWLQEALGNLGERLVVIGRRLQQVNNGHRVAA